MNREDQDFDRLRRLLKLKRYEQPPPRYFNDFSAQVVGRLKAGQSPEFGETWWQRLWSTLELKPAVPVAFGAAICGLLVLGAVYTEKADVPQFSPSVAAIVKPDEGQVSPRQDQIWRTSPNHTSALMGFSTNPVPAGGSLFDQIPLGGPSKLAGHPMFRQ